MTQVVSVARDFELEQIKENNRVQGSGLNTGRDYMTYPHDLNGARNQDVVVKRL